ncbi:hypothetical protein M8C21_019064, partial [Ambrosia artemisiifolia]
MMPPASKSVLFPVGMDDGSSSGLSKGGKGIKRKTPSELRAQQLKRKNIVELTDESPAPEMGSMRNANVVTSEPLKPILSRNPRYIDTRVDELFPSRKISLRLKMLSGKENVKENVTADHTDCLKNSSFSSKLAADRQPQYSGPKDTYVSASTAQSHITNKKRSISTFRSVVELSTRGEKPSGFSLNMNALLQDEAFKGLAARPPTNISISPTESFDGKTNFPSPNFCSEFHRMMNDHTFNGSTAQISNTKALYSWVYPQSSLPPSVISALTLASKGEVCTGQFVAMFTKSSTSTESKPVCNAYVSQSTRHFRSLLKEQDISFTMPLCHSKVEQVTTEDLFELSEIEKHNLGKTRRTVSLSDVDNTPESLLVFSDNNAHGFLLPSLNILDVPSLYSPVPFENAAISAPEVKCKEVRRIDHTSASTTNQPNHVSASISHYTIEIKDAYLPPWLTSSVCDTLRSNGENSFEASFVTEPMSIGLNVGLDSVGQKFEAKDTAVEGLHDTSCPFGVRNTVVSHHLSHGFLKGLKYSNESY